MKFSAAFIAVAITLAASSAEAAPAPKGGFGSTLSNIGSGVSSTFSSGASKLGGTYNDHATTINAGLGGSAGALALGAGAITAETNEDKNNQQPQRRVSTSSRPSSGRTSTSSSADSFHTANGDLSTPGAGAGANAAIKDPPSTGDKINTGVNLMGNAAGGLAIWNAEQGEQQNQAAQQQPQRRLNPAVAAEGAMMVAPMVMGGGGSIGPSFGSTHQDGSAQKSGNANTRVGASSGNSKRALERRLGLSFSDENVDQSAQYSGNSNVRVGAGSGGPDAGRNAILQSLASGGQKQQKRLVSVSSTHEDGSAQQSGNQNVRIGATSGNISPAVWKSLNPGTSY